MGRTLAAALCVFVASCSPCDQIAAGDLCGDHHVVVPYIKFGLLPTVQAKVDGKPFNLLIDTGTNTAIFSATRAEKGQNEFGRDVEVSIGDMEIHFMFAWYADSPFSAPDDNRINGILGVDLLFDLDYQQTQTEIVLSDHPLVCNGPIIQAANQLDYKIILPPIFVDQTAIVDALLDTGAARLLFSRDTVDTLQPYVTKEAHASGFCTFHGCQKSGSFLSSVGRVCVGPVCEDDVPVQYPGWNAVGQSWLQRHESVIISIYRRTLQICP